LIVTKVKFVLGVIEYSFTTFTHILPLHRHLGAGELA
jgi:hypothetical protein